MIQSLDSVLADADASDLEIANEVQPSEVVQPEPIQDEEPDPVDGLPNVNQQAALHAERQRVQAKGRKYTETVADFEKKLAETNSVFEKKLTETLAENDRRWEQRLNEFAKSTQPRAEPQKVETPDPYADPDGYFSHRTGEAIAPIRSDIDVIKAEIANFRAEKVFGGEEQLQAFKQYVVEAQKRGDPEIEGLAAMMNRSPQPYAVAKKWFEARNFDPEKERQRLRDEVMAEMKAGGGGLQPKPTPQPIPSLNRVTAAADEGDEEDDPREVFNTALRSGVRR